MGPKEVLDVKLHIGNWTILIYNQRGMHLCHHIGPLLINKIWSHPIPHLLCNHFYLLFSLDKVYKCKVMEFLKYSFLSAIDLNLFLLVNWRQKIDTIVLSSQDQGVQTFSFPQRISIFQFILFPDQCPSCDWFFIDVYLSVNVTKKCKN